VGKKENIGWYVQGHTKDKQCIEQEW